MVSDFSNMKGVPKNNRNCAHLSVAITKYMFLLLSMKNAVHGEFRSSMWFVPFTRSDYFCKCCFVLFPFFVTVTSLRKKLVITKLCFLLDKMLTKLL